MKQLTKEQHKLVNKLARIEVGNSPAHLIGEYLFGRLTLFQLRKKLLKHYKEYVLRANKIGEALDIMEQLPAGRLPKDKL